MGKIFRNAFAVFKGSLFIAKAMTKKDCSIGSRLRCFFMSDLRLSGHCKCEIGKNVKMDTNVVVSVQPTGNLFIGDNVGFGPNSMIVCHNSISIGNNTIMGPGVYIYDHDHKFSREEGCKSKDYTYGSVEIGSDCWLGAGCIILKGTKIGRGCVIGAGSVLKGNYPEYSIITQKKECEIRELK